MPCNKDCNQGRNCDCSNRVDYHELFLVGLILISLLVAGFGVYKIVEILSKGQDCAIEVQFRDSKATYLGKIV